jgi:hypothetical protein
MNLDKNEQLEREADNVASIIGAVFGVILITVMFKLASG